MNNINSVIIKGRSILPVILTLFVLIILFIVYKLNIFESDFSLWNKDGFFHNRSLMKSHRNEDLTRSGPASLFDRNNIF